MNVNPIFRPPNSRQQSKNGKRPAVPKKSLEQHTTTAEQDNQDLEESTVEDSPQLDTDTWIRKLNDLSLNNGIRFDAVTNSENVLQHWVLIEIETGETVKSLSISQMNKLLEDMSYENFFGEDIVGKLMSITV